MHVRYHGPALTGEPWTGGPGRFRFRNVHEISIALSRGELPNEECGRRVGRVTGVRLRLGEG
jgi:hypothetical protein